MRSKQDGHYHSDARVEAHCLRGPSHLGRGRLVDWTPGEAGSADRGVPDMVFGWPRAWDMTWIPAPPNAGRLDFEGVPVRPPGRAVSQSCREPGPPSAGRCETQMAAFLGEFLASLSRHLPAMTQAQAEALAEPARLLVQACTTPVPPSREFEGAISMLMLERSRQIVRQNLATKGFGPTQLGRLLAVSRSKLYRLFAPSGGVAAFIQRERLQHAMALLSDPTEIRSVNTISAEVGFADHSTFSRAFRRAFGVSPSQARDRSVSRQLASAPGLSDGA